MRISWWGCLVAGALLMCWGVYHDVNQASLPAVLPETSAQAEQRPLDLSPAQPVAAKDESRPQQIAAAPAAAQPDRLPNAQKEPVQKEALLQDAAGAGTREQTQQRPIDQSP